jgi:hypothetical protein
VLEKSLAQIALLIKLNMYVTFGLAGLTDMMGHIRSGTRPLYFFSTDHKDELQSSQLIELSAGLNG